MNEPTDEELDAIEQEALEAEDHDFDSDGHPVSDDLLAPHDEREENKE